MGTHDTRGGPPASPEPDDWEAAGDLVRHNTSFRAGDAAPHFDQAQTAVLAGIQHGREAERGAIERDRIRMVAEHEARLAALWRGDRGEPAPHPDSARLDWLIAASNPYEVFGGPEPIGEWETAEELGAEWRRKIDEAMGMEGEGE